MPCSTQQKKKSEMDAIKSLKVWGENAAAGRGAKRGICLQIIKCSFWCQQDERPDLEKSGNLWECREMETGTNFPKKTPHSQKSLVFHEVPHGTRDGESAGMSHMETWGGNGTDRDPTKTSGVSHLQPTPQEGLNSQELLWISKGERQEESFHPGKKC